MRDPVPRFLLDRIAAGQERGTAQAAALYVDLAGFTPMSEALSAHGSHGAELVAEIVDGTFNPIVAAVHAYGGSIVNSAGDALLAIFTGEHHVARGVAAADTIAATTARAREHATAHGRFTIAAKLGLARGSVSWETLRSRDRQRATYVFGGSAIERAVGAESAAEPGRLIVDPSIEPAARSGAVKSGAPVAARAAYDDTLAQPFASTALDGWDGPGEFRAIVPMFVSIPEPELHRVVDDVLELQDRFGGMCRAIEFGDKGYVLLVVWGAPIGFERDAERALAFATELRRRRPRVRIGASYGVAFTGIIGSDERREFAVVGVDMNLASRLMAAATEGQIMISSSLAARTRDRFAIQSAGSRRLKGIADAVVLHTVLGPAPAADGARSCFGRESELDTLGAALAPLRAGTGAGVIVVSGEAGIGKSMLLGAVRARSSGPRWCTTLADPVWRQALQPLRAAALELTDQSPDASMADNERGFADAIARYGLEPHRDSLAVLCELTAPGSAWQQLAPAERQRRTLDALTALLRAVAEAGEGLVLVVEDLHWADLETRAFLPELAATLAGVPFALLITTRPGAIDPGFDERDDRGVAEIALGPLPADDLGRLAADRLGRELVAATVAWLTEQTGGNPFFAEQLVLYLREQGRLRDSPAGLVAELEQLQVPPSVEEVVVARLDDLPRATRRVVLMASVLGLRPDLGELEAMLTGSGDGDDWGAAVAAAARRGFWSHRGTHLEFAHALVRDASYQTLLIATRRRLHADAAAAIRARQAELGPHLHRLARHHAGAEQFDLAVEHERRAAERALGLGASREAGEYAADGLALLPRLGDPPAARDSELGLWLALGAARIVTHGQAATETKDAYDRASALSGAATHTRAGFQALFGLRTYYLFAGDHDTSLAMAERSLQVAQSVGDEDLLVQAELMVGNARFWVGDLDGAEHHLGEVYRRLSAERDAEHLAGFAQTPRITAVFPAAMTRSLRGDAAGAMTLAEDTLEQARAVGHRFSEAMVLQVLGLLHCRDERPERALATGDELIELAGREGFPVYGAIGALVSGWAKARLGDIDGGLAMINATAARMQTSGTKVATTMIGALIADAHLAAGRPEEAIAATETALADGRRRRELAFVGDLERLRERARRVAEQKQAQTATSER